MTVRSASTAGKIVLKAAVATWQAYNTWGGYDLYQGPGESYSRRSLAVSLDRPYDLNGADMFLTYERNVVKLAESLDLPLAYVTGSDLSADPHLLDGAAALISPGHDEYWTPAERANVTAARDAGVNLAFLGANAMFRRIRLDAGGRTVICYKTSYTDDPEYGKDNALVTSDWREPPVPDPESSLIGTIYEGYPATAAYQVAAPDSWLFAGTKVTEGARFANLVGIEYDRVNPAYPVPRPIQVLSHSPLVCQGASSFGDSAYYTHAGGAGVFNSGTMRWVEAIYGDRPHGIGGRTPPSSSSDDQPAPRLRRRARRGQVPGSRQPRRHTRVRRRPDRQPRQPAVAGRPPPPLPRPPHGDRPGRTAIVRTAGPLAPIGGECRPWPLPDHGSHAGLGTPVPGVAAGTGPAGRGLRSSSEKPAKAGSWIVRHPGLHPPQPRHDGWLRYISRRWPRAAMVTTRAPSSTR